MKLIKTFDKELDSFVNRNRLQPADVIMVKKIPFKLLNHFLVYLGTYRSRHIFMANTLSGIRVFSYHELMHELQTFQPQKIERFTGNEIERKEAVTRALMRKDENSYNLLLNNCEHFKNWVQNGVHESVQTQNAGKAGVAIGVGMMAVGKSDNTKLVGLGLLLLGGLAWALGNDEDNLPAPTRYPRSF